MKSWIAKLAGSALFSLAAVAGGCVGAVDPDVDSAPAPEALAKGGSCAFCGGIAGIPCPDGQICELSGDFPDAAGCCVDARHECDSDDDCFHTGCSGQLCAGEDIITTCEFTCEYGCYSQASCGCVGHKCAFGRDAALARCLAGCKNQGGGGTPCGPATCAPGDVCCNASCGICTPPGGVCIQVVCN
jgi:eight-cysteine-cluster-containing protein